ncbi:MAG: iron oxidase [Gammaproteobacteria bacterium]|nr:iron oxidase [Gammaproteobacteria bacterium]
MSGTKDKISRRAALKSAGMIVLAAVMVAVFFPKIAHLISKARVRYQDHPKGDEYCAGCVNFIPGSMPAVMGACMIVEGAISPQGWCTAFAPKVAP